MSTFVDNDGLRIEVLFSGNGVRAVSSSGRTTASSESCASRLPLQLAATPPAFSPADAPARRTRGGAGGAVSEPRLRRRAIRLLRGPVVAHVGASRSSPTAEAARFCGIVAPTKCALEFLGGGARGEDAERAAVATRPDLPLPGCVRVLDDVDGRVVAHPRAPHGPRRLRDPIQRQVVGQRACGALVVTTKECLIQEQPLGLCAPVPLDAEPADARVRHLRRPAVPRRRRGAGGGVRPAVPARHRPARPTELPGVRSHAARPPRAVDAAEDRPTAGVPRSRVWPSSSGTRRSSERAAATSSSAAPTGRRGGPASWRRSLAREPPLSDRGVYA